MGQTVSPHPDPDSLVTLIVTTHDTASLCVAVSLNYQLAYKMLHHCQRGSDIEPSRY